MTEKQALEQFRKIAKTVHADYMSFGTVFNVMPSREYVGYNLCLQGKNYEIIYHRNSNNLVDLVNDALIAAAAGFPSEPSCDERAGEMDEAIAAMEVV